MMNNKRTFVIKILFLSILFYSCDFSRKEVKTLNNQFFNKSPLVENCDVKIDGIKFYFRKAGNPLNPPLLLLHGFPTNKNTFDKLIPMLASHYYVIAPDNMESEWISKIDPHKIGFTFEMITDHMVKLLDKLKIQDYTLYIQNSASHVGFDLMSRNPKKVDALIIQNADLYIDGLSSKRRELYEKSGAEYSEKHKDFLWTLTGEGALNHKDYLLNLDSNDNSKITNAQNFHLLSTEKGRIALFQLLNDYNNVMKKFPHWQKMLNENQPKTLILWGDSDLAMNFKGAKSYLKDLPEAELFLMKSGKYSDKMFTIEIASHVLAFLQKNVNASEMNQEIEPYLDAL